MPLTIKRTIEPATEPVTLAEVKANSRVDISADDALIESLISAARDYAERFTRRAFITSQFELFLDGFPCVIHLVNPPILSVISVEYVNDAGDTVSLAADKYRVDHDSEPGRISPALGQDWPMASRQINAVKVTYAAGYGAADKVPAAIKQAILLIVGHWYENRESVVVGPAANEVPMAAESLLRMYRVEGLR